MKIKNIWNHLVQFDGCFYIERIMNRCDLGGEKAVEDILSGDFKTWKNINEN